MSIINKTVHRHKIKGRKSAGLFVVQIVGFIIFAIYAVSILGSLIWTFMNSLKMRTEYMDSVVALPEKWLFSNYLKAFEVLEAGGKNVFTMFFNSLWLSVGGPTIGILSASMASYVMAKYKFPGRNLIWGIMITIMVIPIYGATASTYKIYQALNIYDSPFILITKICGLGGNMMMIAAFGSISNTYNEAAFMEGCGHFRAFWQVIFPQVTGLLSALWIMDFISMWNNYMMPIMYLPSYITLTSGLYIYQIEQSRQLDIPVLFAGALLCILPAVVLFTVFQDKFLNLSYGGGIKG